MKHERMIKRKMLVLWESVRIWWACAEFLNGAVQVLLLALVGIVVGTAIIIYFTL